MGEDFLKAGIRARLKNNIRARPIAHKRRQNAGLTCTRHAEEIIITKKWHKSAANRSRTPPECGFQLITKQGRAHNCAPQDWDKSAPKNNIRARPIAHKRRQNAGLTCTRHAKEIIITKKVAQERA